MSLVVSLRVPDGLVVAADSLATAQSIREIGIQNIKVECPKCKAKTTVEKLKLPPILIPFSASSYTQKLFSLYNKFAVSSFGQGVINGKSIFYHISHFEDINEEPDSLEELVDKLITYMGKELIAQFPKYKKEAPKDWRLINFHINGYESEGSEDIGVTYEVFIGKDNIKRKQKKIGCTIGGDMKVVQKLWDIGRENPRLQFKYGLFSLQDAIDLCGFLIEATRKFQRFVNEVPTVGGEIDIALLTPFQGFQWIQQKGLMKILEKSRKEFSNEKKGAEKQK